jgi:mannose-6-phosphate isomerase-like protein (cupin superfamily)
MPRVGAGRDASLWSGPAIVALQPDDDRQRHSESEEGVELEKVNLAEKFAAFSQQWNPKIVGALNGQHVKLVKFEGSFVWHRHDHEDELFLVVRGGFTMHFRERSVALSEGELIIVPRGIEHRPEAQDEVQVLLFEPASTINTGSAPGALTVEAPEWI